jgi:hypothetical protein
MVEYYCGRCRKTFYQKSHADRHRARKTPCTLVTDVTVVISQQHQQQPLDPIIIKPLENLNSM